MMSRPMVARSQREGRSDVKSDALGPDFPMVS